MVRKSCLGCVHYRSLSNVVKSEWHCLYILDNNGKPRGCPPENCTKKETAQKDDPKRKS